MKITKGQSKESKIAHSQKKGRELPPKLSKILAIKKKTNAKSQMRVQDHCKIKPARSHLISHKDQLQILQKS